jgi:MOSC domain-containing protein YiiM
MNFPALSSSIDGLPSKRRPSAISKTAVSGLQKIDAFELLQDEQAELENHGGHDKAIHHYPTDHYAKWIAVGEISVGTVPAAFGENLSTLGLSELDLCIEDKQRLGTAVVQINQGRQPCWKVSEHTEIKKMAYLFQKTPRTGWYYRVLEAGEVAVGDQVTLIERTQPDWSVARVTVTGLTRKVS